MISFSLLSSLLLSLNCQVAARNAVSAEQQLRNLGIARVKRAENAKAAGRSRTPRPSHEINRPSNRKSYCAGCVHIRSMSMPGSLPERVCPVALIS